MYPIERYLGHLKSYVPNKAQPEGSMAEGYLAQEILTFCSRYLDNIETRFNRPSRVDDENNEMEPKSRVSELFPQVGKPIGGSTYFTLTSMEKMQTHRHVLTNCPIVDCYLEEFRGVMKRQLRSRTRNTTEIDKKVHREFVDWFSNRIRSNLINLPELDKEILISLAQGPYDQATRFSAYNVNGYRFRTLARDNALKTQNSGVFGTFGTKSYSSGKDVQMNFGEVPYYGKLIDVIELVYNGFKIPLFKCQWANTTNPRGIKKDKLGFTSVNFARLIHTGDHQDDEPYINVSNAEMVYYVEDLKETCWLLSIHLMPRDLYDMGEDGEASILSITTYPQQTLTLFFPDDNTHIQLVRKATDDDPQSSTANVDEDENEDMVV